MNVKEESLRLKKTIRKNLIELRNKKGISQADVGSVVGKSKNAVASWEQGLSTPDATTLYLLSKFYNVPLDYFYENHSMSKQEVMEEISRLTNDLNDSFRKELIEKLVQETVNSVLNHKRSERLQQKYLDVTKPSNFAAVFNESKQYNAHADDDDNINNGEAFMEGLLAYEKKPQ